MKVWRYLELDKIQHLRNQGRELLGKYIYFTEKRDGSCLSVWLKLLPLKQRIINKIFRRKFDNIPDPAKYKVMVSSRNFEEAEYSIRKDFHLCPDSLNVLDYLNDNPTHVVFGELLRIGKDGKPALSPTRIELHEKVEFIVFDIVDVVQLGSKKYRVDWFGYQQVHQFCYHYGMKCVKLFGEGRFTSTESLYEYVNQMLEICKKEKREGVVGKTFDEDKQPLYFKEKLDTAKSRGQPKLEKGNVRYSPLPLSEAMGAVDKAYSDLGERFGDKKIAMPLVAKYIQEEMKKHLCSAPEYDFYRLYCDYCKDHNIATTTKVIKEPEVTKKSIWKKVLEKLSMNWFRS